MSKNAMDVKLETRELFLRMVGDFAVDRKGVYPDCSNELEELLYLAQIHHRPHHVTPRGNHASDPAMGVFLSP